MRDRCSRTGPALPTAVVVGVMATCACACAGSPNMDVPSVDRSSSGRGDLGQPAISTPSVATVQRLPPADSTVEAPEVSSAPPPAIPEAPRLTSQGYVTWIYPQ